MFTNLINNDYPREKNWVMGVKGRLCFHSVSLLFLIGSITYSNKEVVLKGPPGDSNELENCYMRVRTHAPAHTHTHTHTPLAHAVPDVTRPPMCGYLLVSEAFNLQ